MGAGALGRTVRRARLQAEPLADAAGRGVASPASGSRRKKTRVRLAGLPARRRRPFAGGTDPCSTEHGRLFAAGLGPLVARPGRACRFDSAARVVALPWVAPGPPPAATPRARGALGGRRRLAGQT